MFSRSCVPSSWACASGDLLLEDLAVHRECHPLVERHCSAVARGCLTTCSRRAIDRVAGGPDLDAAGGRGGAHRDRGRECFRGAGGGVPRPGCRTEETVGDIRPGVAATLRERAEAGRCGGRPGGHAGTGGGRPTFHAISTAAAFIAAGASCDVAKHGNPLSHQPVRLGGRARGARRPHRPGAGDVAGCIREIGFGFMFARFTTRRSSTSSRCARSWASGRSSTSSARSRIRPARGAQVIGVSDPGKLETMAAALGQLGARGPW